MFSLLNLRVHLGAFFLFVLNFIDGWDVFSFLMFTGGCFFVFAEKEIATEKMTAAAPAFSIQAGYLACMARVGSLPCLHLSACFPCWRHVLAPHSSLAPRCSRPGFVAPYELRRCNGNKHCHTQMQNEKPAPFLRDTPSEGRRFAGFPQPHLRPSGLVEAGGEHMGASLL